MTTLALVTAIYGGHDRLRPLPAGHGFDDAVCITDDPTLEADGWRVVLLPSTKPPRLAAKYPRMQPFDFVDTDVAVWLDAAFEVVSQDFKQFCTEAVKGKDLVAWDHPENRQCLYTEAAYCQDWPKYASQPIREQTAHYRGLGMPENFGLWACGTIAWRNTEQAKQFGLAWLEENKQWSIQDQVSFPFLLWKLQPRFGVFPAHEFDNHYLKWHQHTRSD